MQGGWSHPCSPRYKPSLPGHHGDTTPDRRRASLEKSLPFLQGEGTHSFTQNYSWSTYCVLRSILEGEDRTGNRTDSPLPGGPILAGGCPPAWGPDQQRRRKGRPAFAPGEPAGVALGPGKWDSGPRSLWGKFC